MPPRFDKSAIRPGVFLTAGGGPATMVISDDPSPPPRYGDKLLAKQTDGLRDIARKQDELAEVIKRVRTVLAGRIK